MQGKMGRARARARALYSQEPVRFEGGQIIVPASRLRGTPAGVRAGDLSRVGLAGSPNPHRSSPGGSEDGASGGCAHHRESTVHPRCPLHSAVLSFFFLAPAHRVRAKNLSQRRLIGFGLFIYFGLRCPASALSAAGLPRVSFSLALPPTNPQAASLLTHLMLLCGAAERNGGNMGSLLPAGHLRTRF